jgi:predicted alpha/beta-fold hydrolase
MSSRSVFTPPFWLRNAHLQSVLPSLKLRHPFVAYRSRKLRECAQSHVIDCGEGTRLLGFLSRQPDESSVARKHLVVLLHGWEGSAESAYVMSLGAHLYANGFDIFRLNFRDHGGTHGLNPEIFHSCRLDEVVGAVHRIQQQFSAPQLSIAGFSLGGNFALRVAARAPAASIDLAHAVAVCPVLHPHSTMRALDEGWFAYRQYFIRKWKASLAIKQQCFPELYDFGPILQMNSLSTMTDRLVRDHSDFADLDAYLNGYAITGNVLEALSVPSHIVFAMDDPIIPHRDLEQLGRSEHLSITRVLRGGHCGFVDSAVRESWADREVLRFMQ